MSTRGPTGNVRNVTPSTPDAEEEREADHERYEADRLEAREQADRERHEARDRRDRDRDR